MLLITAPQGFNPIADDSDMLFESVTCSALQLQAYL